MQTGYVIDTHIASALYVANNKDKVRWGKLEVKALEWRKAWQQMMYSVLTCITASRPPARNCNPIFLSEHWDKVSIYTFTSRDTEEKIHILMAVLYK